MGAARCRCCAMLCAAPRMQRPPMPACIAPRSFRWRTSTAPASKHPIPASSQPSLGGRGGAHAAASQAHATASQSRRTAPCPASASRRRPAARSPGSSRASAAGVQPRSAAPAAPPPPTSATQPPSNAATAWHASVQRGPSLAVTIDVPLSIASRRPCAHISEYWSLHVTAGLAQRACCCSYARRRVAEDASCGDGRVAAAEGCVRRRLWGVWVKLATSGCLGGVWGSGIEGERLERGGWRVGFGLAPRMPLVLSASERLHCRAS